MRLLLDENASDRSFILGLRAAGHDVETSVAVLGVGASDRAIFAHAQATRRAIVTRDCDDFRAVVSGERAHFGLILIYAGGMHPTATFIRAIDNIDATFATIEDLVLSLADFIW